MKTYIFILLLCMSSFANAEKNKSEMQQMPNYLKGIESHGKILRHGYILWLTKKPYTPLIDVGLAKQGSQIYVNHCLECHGEKGKGDGPSAKKYGVQASNMLTSKNILNTHSLFIQVAEGRGDMPQWMDVLTEEEIWALTHYLQSIK